MVAVRASVLAARPGARPRARLERLHAPLPVRGRRPDAAVAARARALAVRGGDRRTRLRDRAVPDHAEPRAPTRPDLAAPTALPVGVRAGLEDRRPALVGAVDRGARLDPALRSGAPGARRDPVLRPLRALPLAGAAGLGADGGRGGRGDPRRRPDPLHGDRGLDRRGRAVAERGARLLRGRRRPLLAQRPPRSRVVRVPRLADPAARDRRVRAPRPRARARARDRARARRARPRPARARHALPPLQPALARAAAAPVPARARADDADRLPGARRARRDRRRRRAPPPRGATRVTARARGGRRRAPDRRPARAGLPPDRCGRLECGVRGGEDGAEGHAARAAGLHAGHPLRQRLPLLRPARPAPAARSGTRRRLQRRRTWSP